MCLAGSFPRQRPLTVQQARSRQSAPAITLARRGSRKGVVATASRCERACKRTGEPSGAFCGKGGARERGDGGFIAADASAKSKKDVGAKRTMRRRGGFSDGCTPYFLDRRRVFSVRRARPGPSPAPRGAAAAKGRKARRRRRARVYKRAAAASGAFCGKGGVRERGDGGFFAADAICQKQKRRRSKADFAPTWRAWQDSNLRPTGS